MRRTVCPDRPITSRDSAQMRIFFSEAKRTRRALALLSGLAMIFALLLLFGLQSARSARAATRPPFIVNFTGDENDTDFPNGSFTGSSDGKCDFDSGTQGDQCTLRAAIQAANKRRGADTIAFNIPVSGVQTISPGSALPQITHKVTIDGYTQPGSSPNTNAQGAINASLLIELDGPGSAFGLELSGDGASNSVIRGLVINDFDAGIFIRSGTGYRIQGNFIGTDPSGTVDEGNRSVGVYMSTSNTTIGGTTPDKRNLISGNNSYGMEVGGRDNKIEGNLIGTNANGTSALANGGYGVLVLSQSSNNTIGDADPSDGATNAANIIAFNAGRGVTLGFGAGNGNRILSNSIHSNSQLGIDLLRQFDPASGVTPNDPTDPDTGPNRLQNYPVITSAQNFGNFTSINGTLNSTPSTRLKKRTFIIQFFSSPSEDPSHFGEGQTFIGQIQVTTDRQGNASFGFAPFQKVNVGQFITATATRKATGDTSEFSGARVVQDLEPG